MVSPEKRIDVLLAAAPKLWPAGRSPDLPQTIGQALSKALLITPDILTGSSVTLDQVEEARDLLVGVPRELLHLKGRFLVADSSIALSRCPAEALPTLIALK